MLPVLPLLATASLRCHWNVDEGCIEHSSVANHPCIPPWFNDGPFGEPTSTHFARDLYVYYEDDLGISPAHYGGMEGSGGLARFMLDRSTNSTYTNWSANYENWVSQHLGRLASDVAHNGMNGPTWNHTDTPSDWTGLAVWDFESFRAHWNIQLGVSWGGAWEKCNPLGGNGPCTTIWHPNHWHWSYFVVNVSSPVFDTALLSAAGFSPPAGASGWADLAATEKLDLLIRSYNHYAEDFFGRTLDRLHAVLPRAKWGIWAYPTSAFPNTTAYFSRHEFMPNCTTDHPDFPCTELADWQAMNDELQWLHRRLDVFLPSFYASGWVSEPGEPVCGPSDAGPHGWEGGCGVPAPPPHTHACPTRYSPTLFERWTEAGNEAHLRSNLDEAKRIRATLAPNATPIISPYVTWHMGSAAGECSNTHSNMSTFISPRDLRQIWELVGPDPEVEGIALWGAPWAENLAKWNHTPEINVSAYFEEVWGPYVREYCVL